MMPNLGKLQRLFVSAVAALEKKEAQVARQSETAAQLEARGAREVIQCKNNVIRAQKALAQGFKITNNRAEMALN